MPVRDATTADGGTLPEREHLPSIRPHRHTGTLLLESAHSTTPDFILRELIEAADSLQGSIQRENVKHMQAIRTKTCAVNDDG